ncbi:MAG: transglutaminaseTgpA domain-containing protein [Verrucomicrobiota bacterium]
MRSPFHQLVLLGLICQGFAWDNVVLPTLNAALWLVCLKLQSRNIRVGPWAEIALIVIGGLAGWFLSRMFGQSAHFAVGHGLTLLQLSRLLRKLETREKIFCLLVAFVQLGVACTIVLDYRFILIVFATIVLIPRTLAELAVESFPARTTAPPARMSFAMYAGVALAMAVFFVTFPRGLLGTGLPRAFGDQSQSNLLDSVLDPTRGSRKNSTEIIMQVEAKSLGYLRSHFLVDFDGQKWTPESRSGWQRIYFLPEEDLKNFPSRRVRVKSVTYLGRILPVDGRVLHVKGKFFRRPFLNTYGVIECEAMWNTSNNIYEYWIDPQPDPERYPIQARRMLRHPEPSAKLRAWLDERLAGATNAFEQAKRLEDYFQRNFKYTLGAPELNRVNHLDDFVFNQREGHCERYASALALLLRMKGVPTRVVIGYAPGARNWFSGWYDIRFSDAHAWTEAWFEGRGWVTLDATPSGTTPKPNYFFRDILDALDVLWYLHIVNFDAPAQRDLITGTVKAATAVSAWAQRNVTGIVLAALGVVAAIGWRNYRPRRRSEKIQPTARQRAQILAEHYYGQMLRTLARQGLHREPHQTPLEFLAQLDRQNVPTLPEIEFITETFCATRYGNAPLTAETERTIAAALERIRQSRKELARAA